MSKFLIESLESRQHLAATLTARDVQTILAQAASQVKDPDHSLQAIVVADREGNILGSLAMGGLSGSSKRQSDLRTQVTTLAALRARTGAAFQSRGEAFTTRTARFIIQDHFPHPINYTPGGPLYGVQFSSLVGSDIVGAGNTGFDAAPSVSGDPGGLPLFKNGEPVGGIGVAGDGRDVAARADLAPLLTRIAPNYYGGNPKRFTVFNGKEENDVDEQLALAGQKGFEPEDFLQADHIFLDGLRVPYTNDKPASGQANRSFAQITSSGDATVVFPIKNTPSAPYPAASFGGVTGFLKNTTRTDFGIVASNDSRGGVTLDESIRLTEADVRQIISDAAKQASITRAGIRKPIGVPAEVHIAVVDRDGDVLGIFKTSDGTNFSFDVAVQKARTAAFFSDDKHAFSTRAIGFMSQQYFPPGIDKDGDDTGPLYKLQDDLMLNLDYTRINRAGVPERLDESKSAVDVTAKFKGVGKNPLKNGITIFPGGVPLYKNGKFVGAIGISGDGVDQDDLIAFTGAKHYQPRVAIRSDSLKQSEIATFITGRVQRIADLFAIDPSRVANAKELLEGTLDFRLPYVKFPRNPEV